jgi:alanine dehydrogenase
MKNSIGIRHEDKYELERRAPLIPGHLEQFIKETGTDVYVESSDKRVFPDNEYEAAGCIVADSVKDCDLILGVKEMPEDTFRKGKAYVFFSHVIKGQDYNMPMLKNLVQQKSSLIDYEKITAGNGQRLIFFGRYAGLAGMINTLWTAGKRFEELGIKTPFQDLKQSYQYSSLDQAKDAIRSAGNRLSEAGLHSETHPLVIAITGDGNVSQGALEILDLIPGKMISPEHLKEGRYDRSRPVVKVNITPEDYLEHIDGEDFDLQHYIDYPDQYRSVFEDFLPHIDILVNGIYWDDKYPKLVTKEWLAKTEAENGRKLKVIGDITCDVNGSIECTEKATEIEDPVFIYNPADDSYRMGFEGDGVAVMAVDILPSELPREASEHFSSALLPFLKDLSEADFSLPYENLDLPPEIMQALIVHKGELTPDYRYLETYI